MPAIDPERLYGTWKLIASRAVDRDGRAIADPWGPSPMGRLVLDRSGRMMAVLCDGRAAMPDGIERAYSSYCGAFSVAGDMLTTVIDTASDRTRLGSHQHRRLELRDDVLVLSPPPRDDGEQREIFWTREAAA